MKTLVLRLDAPLMSFGDVRVDETMPTARFPMLSQIVGLLANVLGLTRQDGQDIQDIQNALSIASRIDRKGDILSDFQTSKISRDDTLWSSFGIVLGRDGGLDTYDSPALATKKYLADASLLVAIGTEDSKLAETLCQALMRPERIPFLGRVCCPPSGPLLEEGYHAPFDGSVWEAIHTCGLEKAESPQCWAQWPRTYGRHGGVYQEVHDIKDWTARLHMGIRPVVEGTIVVRERP